MYRSKVNPAADSSLAMGFFYQRGSTAPKMPKSPRFGKQAVSHERSMLLAKDTPGPGAYGSPQRGPLLASHGSMERSSRFNHDHQLKERAMIPGPGNYSDRFQATSKAKRATSAPFARQKRDYERNIFSGHDVSSSMSTPGPTHYKPVTPASRVGGSMPRQSRNAKNQIHGVHYQDRLENVGPGAFNPSITARGEKTLAHVGGALAKKRNAATVVAGRDLKEQISAPAPNSYAPKLDATRARPAIAVVGNTKRPAPSHADATVPGVGNYTPIFSAASAPSIRASAAY